MSATTVVVLFHFLLLGMEVGAFVLLRLKPRARRLLALAVGVGAATLVIGFCLTSDLLLVMRLLCYALFVHGPLALIASGWLLRHKLRAGLPCIALAAGIIAVGVYAFFIEPYRLEVTVLRIQSDHVTNPMRVVLISDIQTDELGDYEEGVLATIAKLDADLLIFSGDYIQVSEPKRSVLERRLGQMLIEAKLQPRLGTIAVRGDVDTQTWPQIFLGLSAHASSSTQRVELEGITVTALSREDSWDEELTLEGVPGFHIVVGHRPAFALGQIDADLLLAGHTHGGQVRLPGLGPLVTFSKVPRAWASGQTDIGQGRTLIVSRGIGMERAAAPRLRFLCRPEIVVIDLLPSGSSGKANTAFVAKATQRRSLN